MKEITIKSNTHFKGQVLELKVDEIQTADGSYGMREMVMHPGGVCVLAVDEDNYIYLVSQYRKPFEKDLIEVPAGKLEKGENPDEAVKRELKEETGLEAESWQKLGVFMPSPGFCNELIHIYLATDLHQGEAEPDEGELLSLIRVSYDEAYKKIFTGEMTDAKTVLALSLYKNLQERS